MLETRQLRYFVVSADVGSFSEAAKILYTAQSNISRTIAALENELGYDLFLRTAKGIELTAGGAAFYRRANAILKDIESLQSEGSGASARRVRIASNPSSWFADRFSEFYAARADSGELFRVHTDSTDHILRRVGDGIDDIGFVYVFPDRTETFEYEIERRHLRFERLRSVEAMLYTASEWHGVRKDCVDPAAMRFVQMEHDEFAENDSWRLPDGTPVSNRGAAVITNSDYIMSLMLDKNRLANISGESFTRRDAGTAGIQLDHPGGEIMYGILTSRDGTVSETALAFAEHIRKAALQK